MSSAPETSPMKGALAVEANVVTPPREARGKAPPSAAGSNSIVPTTTTDTMVALKDISIASESGWRAIGAIGG